MVFACPVVCVWWYVYVCADVSCCGLQPPCRAAGCQGGSSLGPLPGHLQDVLGEGEPGTGAAAQSLVRCQLLCVLSLLSSNAAMGLQQAAVSTMCSREVLLGPAPCYCVPLS
jgi:hypothetical protein